MNYCVDMCCGMAKYTYNLTFTLNSNNPPLIFILLIYLTVLHTRQNDIKRLYCQYGRSIKLFGDFDPILFKIVKSLFLNFTLTKTLLNASMEMCVF